MKRYSEGYNFNQKEKGICNILILADRLGRQRRGSQEGAVHHSRCHPGLLRRLFYGHRVGHGRPCCRFSFSMCPYSAELVVGDGEQAASMGLYPPENADGITLWTDAAVKVSIEKYDLNIPNDWRTYHGKECAWGI